MSDDDLETKELLHKIHRALVGDKELGVTGLVSRVEDNEEDIKIIKTGIKRFKWTAIGIGAGGFGAGLGGSKLMAVIIKLFSLF